MRTYNNEAAWSVWIDVTNGFPFSGGLLGQYLQIQTTLTSIRGNQSLAPYDLTISRSCGGDGPVEQ